MPTSDKVCEDVVVAKRKPRSRREELLGLRPMRGEYEACSLYEDDGTRPLYASCYRNAACLAVVRENRKLLHFFGDKPTLLFDLASDPRERKNLAEQFPDLVRGWTSDLTRWTQAVEATHAETRDALLAKYVRTKPPKIAKPLGARFGKLLEVLQCTAKRNRRTNIGVVCNFHMLG